MPYLFSSLSISLSSVWEFHINHEKKDHRIKLKIAALGIVSFQMQHSEARLGFTDFSKLRKRLHVGYGANTGEYLTVTATIVRWGDSSFR